MAKQSTCTDCNGRGWKDKIPCVTCNTRGVVFDVLYSQEQINFDKAKNFPDPSDNR